jgi:hypothetical protein
VRGIRVGGATLPADLVVDASGRGSRTPRWLLDSGYPQPAEERVRVDLGYSTGWFDLSSDGLGTDNGIVVGATPDRCRGGGMGRMADGRWLVSLVGYAGDHPPVTPDAFVDFAAGLPTSEIYDVLGAATPLGKVMRYRFPYAVRRHYECLTRFPDGFAVLGDAVCSFNLIYGQGMSVAADQALILRRQLRQGGGSLWGFRRAAAQACRTAWDMSVANDLRLPRWPAGARHRCGSPTPTRHRSAAPRPAMRWSPGRSYGSRTSWTRPPGSCTPASSAACWPLGCAATTPERSMMATDTAARRREDDRSRLRFAMLSVYHHSIGRQFELRGAPSVLLPPEVRPMGLAEALDILRSRPALLRDALWRIIRCVPMARRGGAIRQRYPRELLDVMGSDALDLLDQRRREYRTGAHLFTAALAACADGMWAEFEDLQRLLAEQAKRTANGNDICGATALTLGQSAPDFLRTLTDSGDRERVSDQVAKLEDEVGLDLRDFVEEFADAAAFMEYAENTAPRPAGPGGVTVYPVSSVIRQNTRTLATTATVTTIVKGDFDTLCTALDPRNWPLGNDVVTRTRYVGDSFLRTPVSEDEWPPTGEGYAEARYLEETAELMWGGDPSQRASFENVLLIHPYSVRKDVGIIDLYFSLGSSVRSRVLWDARAGGLLLDYGYIKARRLTEDRWRVTRRKTVKFSDRTPYANGRGWLDVGQMLNYLAPAGLTYWLENDIASLEIPDAAVLASRSDHAAPAPGGGPDGN